MLKRLRKYLRKRGREFDVRIVDRAVRSYHRKDNNRYYRMLKELENIDSLKDFDYFRENIKKYLQDHVPLRLRAYPSDTYYYGYYPSLFSYAGIKDKMPTFPIFSFMEHGTLFPDDNYSLEKLISYCGFGDIHRLNVRSSSNSALFFPIGPYIHYADKYYSPSTEMDIKKRFGRTLLVFPFHTAELGTYLDNSSDVFINAVFSRFADSFDTILVSAYWYDCLSPTFDEYKRRGAKVVSAGFRGDDKFVMRLKSLISISDAVAVDDLGTNMGFSIEMRKPVYFFKGDKHFSSSSYDQYVNRASSAFSWNCSEFTQNQIEQQTAIYNELWGGRYVRNSKEMRAILGTAYLVMKEAHYCSYSFCMNRAATRVLKTLRCNLDDDSNLMLNIMQEALS